MMESLEKSLEKLKKRTVAPKKTGDNGWDENKNYSTRLMKAKVKEIERYSTKTITLYLSLPVIIPL